MATLLGKGSADSSDDHTMDESPSCWSAWSTRTLIAGEVLSLIINRIKGARCPPHVGLDKDKSTRLFEMRC